MSRKRPPSRLKPLQQPTRESASALASARATGGTVLDPNLMLREHRSTLQTWAGWKTPVQPREAFTTPAPALEPVLVAEVGAPAARHAVNLRRILTRIERDTMRALKPAIAKAAKGVATVMDAQPLLSDVELTAALQPLNDALRRELLRVLPQVVDSARQEAAKLTPITAAPLPSEAELLDLVLAGTSLRELLS
ncbi:hypothetical protein [Synechococcus sp. 1G10]|uniref:hypothetical protein n=1 Tax=Synechococcus sp. 1G10 TaxID=2025605 RepID=UPI000B994450|nr:hypothetical protein [Synechococcus sp. 1G10]